MRHFPLALVLAAGTASAAPLTVDDCVARALAEGAEVRLAEAELSRLQAEAQEVRALLSPKISGTALATPLYGATGGLGHDEAYRIDLTTWGPYVSASGRVVKPISTFGRYTAGVKAADERALMEEEKVREVANGVALEVRRLYGLRLYAKVLGKMLETADGQLTKAHERAKALYDGGGGEVTLSDVMKLEYGSLEIRRFLRLARDGEALAIRALKHAMGLGADEALELAEDRLAPPKELPAELDVLFAKAAENRPELKQIDHGRAAAGALARAERLAAAPVLFLGAAASANWSPVRPRGYSASFVNTFNDYYGGVGIGLNFDIDPGKRSAKIEQAEALTEKVDASEALARTGIPLQVYKARQELVQHIELAKLANEQVKATRKWLMSAAAAYESGTGEAKDLLEGLVANLQARRTYYDHALGSWVAQAELERAVGGR